MIGIYVTRGYLVVLGLLSLWAAFGLWMAWTSDPPGQAQPSRPPNITPSPNPPKPPPKD